MAMGAQEKIEAIQFEMSRTQKNKATEYHLGLLKGKLAKLRHQLLEPAKTSKPGEGFDVQKHGDARIALIGLPSVGKSSLLNKVTKTESEEGAWEFTTLTAIPGVLMYEGVKLQLLDLPGIIEGAASGKGRGRQVVSVAKTADLIVMLLDASKGDGQKELLEAELEAVGLRLNKTKPDVKIKKKTGGGVTINAMVPLTKMDPRLIKSLCTTYKIHNAEVFIREDITVDEFIDIILGNRKYVPCLYVYSKIDLVSLEEVNRLAHLPKSMVLSVLMDLNLDYFVQRVWKELGLVKIYTKKRGIAPDLNDPVCLRPGAIIQDVCIAIHRALLDKFSYAVVYGASSRFGETPQKVNLKHVVEADDVVTIVTK